MIKLRSLLAGALLALAPLLGGGEARAQSGCPYIVYGAVLTVAQWQSCFQAKNDSLNFSPVNKAGDTMTGKLVTAPSTAGSAGFSLFTGSAPSSPQDGDMWMTLTGVFARVNGATVGPFGTGGGGGGVSAITAGTGLSGGTITTSGTIAIATTGVTAGTYGSATQSAQCIFNAQGQATSCTNVPITGGVSSVANSDSTLTISPTTGNVVASLNLANLNIWLAQQTITLNQNAATYWRTTNNSAGVNALAGFQATNGTGNVFFGITGTGYTGIAGGQNYAVVFPDASVNGLLFYLQGNVPTIFYRGGAEVGRWDGATAGLLRVGVAGSVQGQVALCPSVGASCINLLAASSTTNYNVIFPTSAGTSGQIQQSQGNNNPSQWVNVASVLTAGTGITFSGTTNVTIGLGAIAADTLLANATGGSAAPTGVAIGNCTNALTYNTTTHAFGCNTTAGTGTVTSVAAGTGLNVGAGPGGTITSSGTLNLANTAVTPGSYTAATVTVDQQGRLTAASSSNAFLSVVVQTFTTPGASTYTPTTGMRFAIVECVGGGGSGAGVPTQAPSGGGVTGGGGGGGYARVRLTAAQIGASKTATVGAGGAAPTAGSAGNNGSASSLGSLCSANGGNGAPVGSTAGAWTSARGGAGGTATIGDVLVGGAGGGGGIGNDGNAIIAGNGGSSHLGGGGAGSNFGVGDNGGNYGGGGGGSAQCCSGGAISAGSGAPGIVIVTEFVNQ